MKLSKLLFRKLIIIIRDKYTLLPIFSFIIKGYKILLLAIIFLFLFSYLFFILFSSVEMFHSFTPLGNIKIKNNRNIEKMIILDSLAKSLEKKQKVVDAFLSEVPKDFRYDTTINLSNIDIKTNKMFNPVKGIISKKFVPKKLHFGIDIASKDKETIHSIYKGIVVHSAFDNKNGGVILIQHNSGLVSVYKHCSKIYVKIGDRVKSGQKIALVGTYGENSYGGPHLHFEIWKYGVPKNPLKYIKY